MSETDSASNEPGLADETRVAVLIDDMFFLSKVRGAAGASGFGLQVIRKPEDLVGPVEGVSLIALDLNSSRWEPVSTIRLLKSSAAWGSIPILGFLSHVQVDLKKMAEEAGCDYVIPRSLFSKSLTHVVAGDLSFLDR